MKYPDKTESISFNDVKEETVPVLLEEGVVVIKGLVSAVYLDGIKKAFHSSRRHDLPRRISGKLMALSGMGNTKLYKNTRVSDIAYDPTNLPKYMQSAQPVLSTIIDLNSKFFENTLISDIYGIRTLNLAHFFVSPADGPAIGEHQDSQGATGLAFAPQTQPTLWHIHRFIQRGNFDGTSIPPFPVDFSFNTEAGDVVVLAERRGRCPDKVEFREGTSRYYRDGSRIHSGENLTGLDRYGMGVFHQEIMETIV